MGVKNISNELLRKPVRNLVLLALLARLLAALFYQHVTTFPDSFGYTPLAKLISAGSLNGYTGERSPGYPMLISLCGNNLTVTAIVQVILGLLTTVIAYNVALLAKLGKGSAFFLTLAFSCSLHAIFYETAILTESLTLLSILLITFFTLKFLESTDWKTAAILSILLGYLVLIKPFYIYLPFVIYFINALKRFNLKYRLANGIILLILPIIAFTGWSYVNKINTGYFTSTTYFGINIAQNCVSFAEKAPAEYKYISNIYVKHREQAIAEHKDVAMSIWFAYPELKKKTGLSDIELNMLLGRYGKEVIKNNPLDFAKQVFVSWKGFWDVDIYWNYDQFNVSGANKVFLGLWFIQYAILLVIKLLFLICVPIIVYRSFRDRSVSVEFVLTVVIISTSMLQATATFGTNARYSYPFEFLMGIVVFRIIRRLRSQCKYLNSKGSTSKIISRPR